MSANKIRLLLKEETTEADLDRFAYNSHWKIRALKKANPEEDQPYEMIWSTQDELTTIHYIEDHVLVLRYLVVKGEEVAGVVENIRASVSLYSADTVWETIAAASTPNEMIGAIYRLGVVAPQSFDQVFFNQFRQMLVHSDAKVRRATLLAIAYVGWPEFKPVLRELSEGDPDYGVQRRAQILLDGYQELNLD